MRDGRESPESGDRGNRCGGEGDEKAHGGGVDAQWQRRWQWTPGPNSTVEKAAATVAAGWAARVVAMSLSENGGEGDGWWRLLILEATTWHMTAATRREAAEWQRRR